MRTLFTFLLILAATYSFGQNAEIDKYITFNGNLYVPIGNNPKGTYPILWYDKDTDPKVLIGGFGVGFTGIKQASSKVDLKAQVNLSKHTYWDEAVSLRDGFGMPMNNAYSGTSDFCMGISATANYHLSEHFTVGSGLGTQVLLLSLSRLPNTYSRYSQSSEDKEINIARNRFYKPVIPTIPIDLTYRTTNKLFTIRYEQALLNKIKGELKEYKKDRFGLLYFEVGFKLN